MVVTEDFIQRWITDETLKQQVLEQRKMLLDHQVLMQLQSQV